MPRVSITVDLTHADAMTLLGTLRRELRCLHYAAQNPERRDREDLEQRRRQLDPLVPILGDLCDAAKLAEQKSLPRVLTWRDEHGHPQFACLDDNDLFLKPAPAGQPNRQEKETRP